MQFNVNEGVVKMLEVLANYPSLQILLVVLIVSHKLPDIIKAIRWW